MASLATWWSDLSSGRPDFLVAGERRLPRGDLAGVVRHFCGAFDTAGLSPGSRIAIVVADEMAAIAAFVAALFDGLVPVMLTCDAPPERLTAIMRFLAPDGIVVSQSRQHEAWAGLAQVRFVHAGHEARRGWFARRPGAAESLLQAFSLPHTPREPRLPADPEGLAYILFTSGTTSSPSGVMIRRRNLFANLQTISRVLDVKEGSRVFNDMVLAHGDGLVQGPLLALASNATLIRAGGFAVERLEQWLETVRREGATHLITVPTIWALIDRYAQYDDYFAVPGFRAVSSVAAPLPPALWQRIETRFGQPLTNQYGLTETVASALYAGPHPDAGARDSVGRPIDCEIRIVAVDGEQDGGELQIRGSNIFAGYWQDEDRSRAAFTADGWFRTGDLARQDGAGNVHIIGRIKTIMKSGGLLIRPEEVDEGLQRHPAVISSITLAMPDEVFGEIAVSVVEVAQAQMDELALVTHARTVLEPLKVPKRIFTVDRIPRGDAGKPSLDKVREMVTSRLTARGPGHGETDTVELAVLETAAQVFRVDPESLTLRSTPATVPGWDSFQQLAFQLALERRFAIRMPISRAASIRSLAAAVEAVKAALPPAGRG